MFSTLIRLTLWLYALQTTLAQTPPNFLPAVSTHLTVTYGTEAINPAGITVPASGLADVPSLGLPGTHSGNYVVIFIDFSINLSGGTTSNTTLLHWILGGLSSPNETTTLTSHEGEIAPYFAPGPPPGQTHTYGVFLYSEPAKFEVPADYIPFFNNLTASIYNRIGFNLTHFVAETGLGKPLAADWFLVSTPSTTSSSTGASSTASSDTTTGNTATGATTMATVTGAVTTSGSASISQTSSAPLVTVTKSGATKLGLQMMAIALVGAGLGLNLL